MADWRSLAHRTIGDLAAAGIQLLLNHTAHTIHPSGNRVAVTDPRGRQRFLPYDRPVVATGAMPARPPIPGLKPPGVHLLHTMGDTFALEHALAVRAPCPVVIVGGGYIGLEMAEALTTRGLAVTLVEQAPTVMPNVDAEVGRRIGAELAAHGVTVHTGLAVTASRGVGGQADRHPRRRAVPRHDRRGPQRLRPELHPTVGSPWDAVQMAAQTWTRHTHGRIPTQAPSHQDGNTSTSTVPPPRS